MTTETGRLIDIEKLFKIRKMAADRVSLIQKQADKVRAFQRRLREVSNR